jgi:RNA polymerase sigma-70 factor (ECF subfamily)
MNPLGLLAPPPATPTADAACLEAFQRDLDHVYRTLQRLGTTPSDADDLVQEVFLALRQSWSKVDHARPLRPFLFGIMFRIVAALRRKRRREVTRALIEVADAGPTPDDLLAAKRARRIVLSALDQIPLPRRAAFIMHEIDGVPVKEVATLLGVAQFTVYSRLRKARSEFKRIVRRLVSNGRL